MNLIILLVKEDYASEGSPGNDLSKYFYAFGVRLKVIEAAVPDNRRGMCAAGSHRSQCAGRIGGSNRYQDPPCRRWGF